MNTDLRRLVHDRLSAEDFLTKNWSALVLAACDGRDALDGVTIVVGRNGSGKSSFAEG